jgi:hypothetical protein
MPAKQWTATVLLGESVAACSADSGPKQAAGKAGGALMRRRLPQSGRHLGCGELIAGALCRLFALFLHRRAEFDLLHCRGAGAAVPCRTFRRIKKCVQRI